MNSVFTQIQNHYDELSSTEQLVIDFVLKYDNTKDLKLKTIEDHLKISAPTIIRAVKKLNYNSFTEFKYTLINSQTNSFQSSSEQTFESMLQLISTDFNRTIEMMERNKLIEIASTILVSRRIFCIGVGSSSNVASLLNHKLKNFGLWSNDYTDIFPIKNVPDLTEKEDCVLLFSLSGSEQQIIDVVTECKVKGVKTIAITSFSMNLLASLSDISLLVHQSIPKRRKLRSRLMLTIASEIIFETVLLLKKCEN